MGAGLSEAADLTAAEYLTAWKRRSGLTDERAAAWCELSVSAFRRQRSGRVSGDHCRQTVKLAELYGLVAVNWLDIAAIATKLAHRVGGGGDRR